MLARVGKKDFGDPPQGYFDRPSDWPRDFYKWQRWDGALWQDIPSATTDTLDSSNFDANDWIKGHMLSVGLGVYS